MPKALDPLFDSFYRPLTDADGSRVLLVWGPFTVRAVSSVVEHFVDIEGVTSSNLVPPTIEFIAPRGTTVTRRNRRAAKKEKAVKVANSLRSLKQRHRDCRVVRRKGRVYVINKTQRRFKARQG